MDQNRRSEAVPAAHNRRRGWPAIVVLRASHPASFFSRSLRIPGRPQVSKKYPEPAYLLVAQCYEYTFEASYRYGEPLPVGRNTK